MYKSFDRFSHKLISCDQEHDVKMHFSSKYIFTFSIILWIHENITSRLYEFSKNRYASIGHVNSTCHWILCFKFSIFFISRAAHPLLFRGSCFVLYFFFFKFDNFASGRFFSLFTWETVFAGGLLVGGGRLLGKIRRIKSQIIAITKERSQ